MSEGIVYILTNEAMPDIVKIGKTDLPIEKRFLHQLDDFSGNFLASQPVRVRAIVAHVAREIWSRRFKSEQARALRTVLRSYRTTRWVDWCRRYVVRIDFFQPGGM